MNPGKYEFADGSDHRPDAFDRELDETLANYATVNPRTGLEGRIMARIAGERKHSGVGFPWRWPVVAFVALSLMLAITIHLKSSKPARREIAPCWGGAGLEPEDQRVTLPALMQDVQTFRWRLVLPTLARTR